MYVCFMYAYVWLIFITRPTLGLSKSYVTKIVLFSSLAYDRWFTKENFLARDLISCSYSLSETLECIRNSSTS